MAKTRDRYVLVPDEKRTSVLVTRSNGGWSLPMVTVEAGPEPMLTALRDAYGLEAQYLRFGRFESDDEVGVRAVLDELDAPQPGWAPSAGISWAACDGVDPADLAPASFTAAVARWLAEQSGAPIPELRSPWARPGWRADADRWISSTLSSLRLEQRGRTEIVEQWPLSSILRVDTDEGRVYFKAAFTLFRHEPRVTAALARNDPDRFPAVLAIDEPRGWMLMRELAGSELGDLEKSRWVDGPRTMAEIQQVWAGRGEELLALGIPDRTLARLAADARESLELDDEGLARLERSIPEIERRCEALAAGPLPETLLHGDLHPGNVMVDGDSVRIFDWSDACLSYPLFDLPTFVGWLKDEAAHAPLVDAYLTTWSSLASLDELRELAALAEPLAALHHAVSYQRIVDVLEPADRWLFADEPRRWLIRALDSLEAQ